MKDGNDGSVQAGKEAAARRAFLARLGQASLGAPATLLLMSVTEKRAKATGAIISGGGSHSGNGNGQHKGFSQRQWGWGRGRGRGGWF